MKYVVIVHKDPESDYGIIVPDYPGCFSSASTPEDIPAHVQEAIQCYAEGEDGFTPAVPSTFDEVAKLEDAQNGVLMFVDVNFDFLDKKTVPCNITMPRYMRDFVDRRARELGMSRSGFLQAAAQAYRPSA
ncbi:type II toxin-antitoxin system HicB family antitoxin [uncultured Mailhella sp.]|uniref:type II toxin-antitoxin system HicB family antitoxin n=1 Tax=uncultured Mailhella sp. TaxID=1981031 RepID=UPI0025FD9530|nr:type II toxin-antitoxin system HicB family antitoxin [uncultured Mailhella sp.]